MIEFFKLWFEKEESDMMSDFPANKTTKLVYLIDIGQYRRILKFTSLNLKNIASGNSRYNVAQ